MNAHFKLPKYTKEDDEKARKAWRLAHATEEAAEAKKRQLGYCDKCHTYCHGDCKGR